MRVILLVFCLFMFIGDYSVVSQSSINNEILNIAVYYGSRCPDSMRFIVNHLTKNVEEFSDILNVVLVPYGKANYTWVPETSSWSFTCQRAGPECLANRFHNCFIYHRPKLEEHLPFIDCMMKDVTGNVTEIAAECARIHTKNPVNFDDLSDCANGALGNQLKYSAGFYTHKLIPPLTYIPWIVVDNIHTAEIQRSAEFSLKEFICDYYKGSRPASCPKIEQQSTTPSSATGLQINKWYLLPLIIMCIIDRIRIAF